MNFILPFLPTKPVGGAKNMYEFANRLSARGHEITLIHSVKRPFKKQRIPAWLRVMIIKWRARKTRWFNLSPALKVIIVPEVTDKYVPDADVTLSTWWQMAYAVAQLSGTKGRKFNFVQDYELWKGQEDKVHASYALPVGHIVIARYLQTLIKEVASADATLVNTPIDTTRFTWITPQEDRFPRSIFMMYSEEPRKGTKYGVQALLRLKEQWPDLRVSLFSVYQRPADLPEWIKFYHRPNNLPALYNEHAIFISPSLGEGWALPCAEAMACGCALVCTDIGGHHDYAVEGQTALLVEPQNVEQMVDKINTMITQTATRLRMASAGHKTITEDFSWDVSVRQMEAVLLNEEPQATESDSYLSQSA